MNDTSSTPQDQVEQDTERQLEGIAGWLILPAIGLVLNPILASIGLFLLLRMYRDAARAGYGSVYVLEMIVGFGLLLLAVYAAIQFFGKKKGAPRTMIILISANLVASLVLLGIESSAGPEALAVESAKQLPIQIAAAVIWIPYFLVSKRVKATFVS